MTRVIEVIRRGRRGQDGSSGLVTVTSKSTSFTATNLEKTHLFLCTAALTASFDPTSSLASGWHCYIDATGGDVILDPDESELINGLATVTVPNGTTALVYTDGGELYARWFYDTANVSLLGLPTAAGKFAYSTGAGVWAEGDVTGAGRALIDDADAEAQRATLEVAADSADANFANDTSAAARRGLVKTLVDNQTAILSDSYSTDAGLTTAIPFDGTVPTSSEGTEILSIANVVVATGEKVRLDFSCIASCSSTGAYGTFALFRDTTCIRAAGFQQDSATNAHPISFVEVDAPSAGTYTYSVRAGPSTGTLNVNRNDVSYGTASKSVLVASVR